MQDLFMSDHFLKAVYSLSFIIIILVGISMGVTLLRRRGQKETRETLSYNPGVVLDPKRRLIVIKWQQKEYLVLVGPMGETVIDHRDIKPDKETLSPMPPADVSSSTHVDGYNRIAPTFSKPYNLTDNHAS